MIDDDVITAHEHVETAAVRMMSVSWMLAAGDRDRAERTYRALPAAGFGPDFFQLITLSLLADLAAEFGDPATAERVYSLLSRYADLFVCGGAGVVLILGSVQEYLSAPPPPPAAVTRTPSGICGRPSKRTSVPACPAMSPLRHTGWASC
ncbi:hypothetical protein [Fodinicola feengrottensis]|uniref:hypothetical protein n=1 Tax=Fodinicola feengrottensis TaxID=435914 RepID=UPI0013D4611B|nr:hypothetical protein [Fodinicola feengrottensis]